MGIIKEMKNALKYLENFRDTQKILKENNGFMTQSGAGTPLLAIPIYSREKLNEMEVIKDKDIGYERKEVIKDVYSFLFRKRFPIEEFPPLQFNFRIGGPVSNNIKYNDLKEKLEKEASEIYETKLNELGAEGRGQTLEITYYTSDFDLINKDFFEDLAEELEMGMGNMFRALSLFNSNNVFCYVSEIESSDNFIEKLNKTVGIINVLRKGE